MFNPTWFYTGALYSAAVWLARRAGVELPRRVAIFFFALVLLFLWLPLTQDYVNLSVDYLGVLPPWQHVTPDHDSSNGMMNDLPLQIVPWAHQVREAWRALKPPLWNNFSGAGYPLLASGQSSAFSPFRILGLPLGLAHAMTFEAAAKLLVAMTFMFLWSRRRGYSELASAAAGVAFAFSTFLLVWLHFPMVSTACFVPAVFYFVDLLGEGPTHARFVGISLVWAFMLFGGHPETVAHAAFVATAYVSWIVAIERRAGWQLVRRHFAALGVAALIALPFLAPFAEAVTKSKRFTELRMSSRDGSVPFADLDSAKLLVAPHLFGKLPLETPWGPTHPESLGGFAGILGIAGWFALLAHVVSRRKWRSTEAFFLIATLLALGVVLGWPGISDLFHLVFQLAANARVRLFLVLFLAIQTAALVDLLERDRRAVLVGIAAAATLLLLLLYGSDFANAYQRDSAVLALLPSVALLTIATGAAVTATDRNARSSVPQRARLHGAAVLLLLTGVTAELWQTGYDWNPIDSDWWMYPRTPLIERLDELRAAIPETEPFRVTGAGSALFPNSSAVYGYEDVRVHDPMANARYLELLEAVVDYDSWHYFAPWKRFDKRFVDFLNVRYVVTPPKWEMPDRFAVVYDGHDGRIFENLAVLSRFYPIRNVLLQYRRDLFLAEMKSFDGWSHTAFLDDLQLEEPRMEDDFFKPRPDDAPIAALTMTQANPTDFRMQVKAPRYSLIASSIPWWPGWKVERNGARIDPVRVNGGFLGFVAPPGEIDVRVWYDPWTFRYGSIIAAATLSALLAYPYVSRKATAPSE